MIRCSESGFSLIETLLVILISTFTFVIAAPNYTSLLSSMDKSRSLEQLRADFARARAHANSKSARVIFSVNNSQHKYSFGVDNYPYNDPVAADSTLYSTVFPDRISIIPNETIIFGPEGKLINANDEVNEAEIALKYQDETYTNLKVYLSGFIEKQ